MVTGHGEMPRTQVTKGVRIMRKFAFLWKICMILAFQVGPLTAAQANVVGRLTLVEGRVDILRGGQLPAIRTGTVTVTPASKPRGCAPAAGRPIR